MDSVMSMTGEAAPDTFVLCIAEAPGGASFDGTLIGVADGPLPVS
jgi:hypothetical protein